MNIGVYWQYWSSCENSGMNPGVMRRRASNAEIGLATAEILPCSAIYSVTSGILVLRLHFWALDYAVLALDRKQHTATITTRKQARNIHSYISGGRWKENLPMRHRFRFCRSPSKSLPSGVDFFPTIPKPCSQTCSPQQAVWVHLPVAALLLSAPCSPRRRR